MPDSDETPTVPADTESLSEAPDRKIEVVRKIAETTSSLEPGQCLGRYTVIRRIGEGGMGQVFAAHDPELDRVVALKILRPGLGGGSPETRVRFQREAQAMARLNHPNVVSVFDVGTVGTRVFVAMELVEGPNLAVWLAARRRGWREIVEVFLAAGRGLEAAHAAGIVHRDFKPANVIVGDRVRVVDFGLARAAGDPAPETGAATTDSDAMVESPASSATPASPRAPATVLLAEMTATGRAVGTPAYMAPEQRAGQRATPLADQYSFAVALQEALIGVRSGALPDSTVDVNASETATAAARAAAAERRARARHVPGAIMAVVQRALASRPEDRYPSMRELLADLARDRARARRRWLVGGGAAALVAALVVLAIVRLRAGGPAADPCGAGAALASEVWNDAARARVRDAFAATGRPGAAATLERVDGALSRQLAGWAREYRAACEATHVRHQQSDALLDLRMACLERARHGATSLVTLLGEAAPETVDRAVGAAAAAVDTFGCADAAQLTAAVPTPRDPAQAREVAAIRDEIDRIDGLSRVGRAKDSLAAARALVPRARAVGYAPMTAAATLASAQVEQAGDLDAALTQAYEAASRAEEARDDALRGRALVLLVRLLGQYQHRFAEADALIPLAAAAVARAGNPPALLRALYQAQGDVASQKKDPARALLLYASELMLAARADGEDSISAARALRELGDELRALGRPAQARAVLERVVTTTEAALGPDHPAVSDALLSVSRVADHLGDYAAAEQATRRALALRERVYGPDSRAVLEPLLQLTRYLAVAQRMGEARQTAERAEAIVAHLGSQDTYVIIVETYLAAIEGMEGKFEAALARQQKVLALAEKIDGPEHPDVASDWEMVGQFQRHLRRLDEARAAFERTLAIRRKVLGEDHPLTGDARVFLGDLLVNQGRVTEGLALIERGLSSLEAGFGPHEDSVVNARIKHGLALLAARQPRRAAEVGEQALGAAAQGHLGPELSGLAGFLVARALMASGGDRARACALAGEARTRFGGLPYADALPALERWRERECAGAGAR
jgi:eukaryotic-like serine/threonine-protein kinase